MSEALAEILKILKTNRRINAGGVPSICSAHPMVLRACMELAKEEESTLLIESTSNQVDQFGGYTGMTPEGFRVFIGQVADASGFSIGRIVLGGDHLGPNRWRALGEGPAMARAKDLVRAYVRAGYEKIHLDASMHLAGDPGDTSERPAAEVVAERTALLALAAEEVVRELRGVAPIFVIGTEVPVPGGPQVEPDKTIQPTSAEDVSRTVDVMRDSFCRRGLEDAWGRVIAVVVQPGVEFTNDSVLEYDRARAADLSNWIQRIPGLVFEAHSTDYQSGTALRQMVEDHFSILKVGPALTFAFREAIFALDRIEEELITRAEDRSRLREHLDLAMQADPTHWKPYSKGSEEQQRLSRNFGYSDRTRYYWAQPQMLKGLEKLFTNLSARDVPLTLLSQYLPRQYEAARRGSIARTPQAWVWHRIREVVEVYNNSCRQ